MLMLIPRWILSLLLPLPFFLFAAPRLSAQPSPPRTVYSPTTALFQVVPDQSLYCRAVQFDQAHRTMGIVKMFEFQLPMTRRLGLLGLTANSTVRYLAVTIEIPGVPYSQRHTATVHFTPRGAVEIGRQSWELARADSMPERQVYGLSADDGPTALALARDLAARCH